MINIDKPAAPRPPEKPSPIIKEGYKSQNNLGYKSQQKTNKSNNSH
jgi:hypothetical protein